MTWHNILYAWGTTFDSFLADICKNQLEPVLNLQSRLHFWDVLDMIPYRYIRGKSSERITQLYSVNFFYVVRRIESSTVQISKFSH